MDIGVTLFPTDETISPAELRDRAEETGRGHLPVSIYGAKPRPGALIGLAEAGVDRAIRWLPPAGREVVIDKLRGYTDLLDAVASHDRR